MLRVGLLLLLAASAADVALVAATPPSDGAVHDAAWTFILSAAAHLTDAESDPNKMCRTALATLMRWLPDARTRARLVALAQSPVVRERVEFLPTMDDCTILLWYVRAADGLALGKKVAPAGLAPDGAFAPMPTAGAQAEARALWVSPKREAVLAAVDHAWLGRAAPHPPIASARPSLDLFVMSACPYGVAAEDVLFGQVLPRLGDSLELRLRFITFSRFAGPNGTAVPDGYCASAKGLGSGRGRAPALGEADDVPCSMHGAGEAEEDARQMAVAALHGGAKLRQYVLAFNALQCAVADYGNCYAKAAKAVGIDGPEVLATARDNLGAYAAEARDAAQQLAAPALRGAELSSPTLLVNGHVAALGALDAAGYTRRICAFFEAGARPPACDDEGAGDVGGDGSAGEGGGGGVPSGASCVRADALPREVPLPARLQGPRTRQPGLPAAAASACVLAAVAAVFALLAASLRRGGPRGGLGLGPAATGASASVPLV